MEDNATQFLCQSAAVTVDVGNDNTLGDHDGAEKLSKLQLSASLRRQRRLGAQLTFKFDLKLGQLFVIVDGEPTVRRHDAVISGWHSLSHAALSAGSPCVDRSRAGTRRGTPGAGALLHPHPHLYFSDEQEALNRGLDVFDRIMVDSVFLPVPYPKHYMNGLDMRAEMVQTVPLMITSTAFRRLCVGEFTLRAEDNDGFASMSEICAVFDGNRAFIGHLVLGASLARQYSQDLAFTSAMTDQPSQCTPGRSTPLRIASLLIARSADIYGLLRFGRFKPWSDWNSLNEHVARRAAGGSARAQVVLKLLLLLRTKPRPSRLEGRSQMRERPKLQFSDEEREIYNSYEKQSKISFNRFIRAGTLIEQCSHAAVLVLILRLCQVCCRPHLVLIITEFVPTCGYETRADSSYPDPSAEDRIPSFLSAFPTFTRSSSHASLPATPAHPRTPLRIFEETDKSYSPTCCRNSLTTSTERSNDQGTTLSARWPARIDSLVVFHPGAYLRLVVRTLLHQLCDENRRMSDPGAISDIKILNDMKYLSTFIEGVLTSLLLSHTPAPLANLTGYALPLGTSRLARRPIESRSRRRTTRSAARAHDEPHDPGSIFIVFGAVLQDFDAAAAPGTVEEGMGMRYLSYAYSIPSPTLANPFPAQAMFPSTSTLDILRPHPDLLPWPPRHVSRVLAATRLPMYLISIPRIPPCTRSPRLATSIPSHGRGSSLSHGLKEGKELMYTFPLSPVLRRRTRQRPLISTRTTPALQYRYGSSLASRRQYGDTAASLAVSPRARHSRSHTSSMSSHSHKRRSLSPKHAADRQASSRSTGIPLRAGHLSARSRCIIVAVDDFYHGHGTITMAEDESCTSGAHSCQGTSEFHSDSHSSAPPHAPGARASDTRSGGVLGGGDADVPLRAGSRDAAEFLVRDEADWVHLRRRKALPHDTRDRPPPARRGRREGTRPEGGGCGLDDGDIFERLAHPPPMLRMPRRLHSRTLARTTTRVPPRTWRRRAAAGCVDRTWAAPITPRLGASAGAGLGTYIEDDWVNPVKPPPTLAPTAEKGSRSKGKKAMAVPSIICFRCQRRLRTEGRRSRGRSNPGGRYPPCTGHDGAATVTAHTHRVGLSTDSTVHAVRGKLTLAMSVAS
ncbi:hypothetical protein B0H12DRAFT_1067197 [Mycena haematopus]|nr:hypothetical protein B0H12DRAFT_1067197 [Mycena haematopus]